MSVKWMQVVRTAARHKRGCFYRMFVGFSDSQTDYGGSRC